MKRAIVILGLLLSACASDSKYLVMPDGSRPLLFPVQTVMSWQVVDGARQAPSGRVRITIDATARFGNDVQLSDGVRIGAHTYIHEDAVLMPNVTVGEGTTLGGDVIVQSDVKIGKQVVIGGDTKIGTGAVIEDGVTTGTWVKIGSRAVIGARAKIGPASLIEDGATIAKDQIVPQGSRIGAAK